MVSEKRTGPKVSIIVPVYNTYKYLRKCLDSLVSQDYGNLEIIVVDDGSPDESGEVCDQYARLHKSVTVIHQQNVGVSAARNRALDVATGDYVWFCDSDDWIEGDAVSRLVSIANENDADLVIFSLIEEKVEGGSGGLIRAKSDPDLVSLGPLQCDNPLYPQAHFAKAELLEGLRFSEDLALLEDREFFYKVCLRAKHAVVVEDVLYHYLINRADSAVNRSFSQKNVDSNRVEYEIMLSELKRGYVMPAYGHFAAHSLGMLGEICKRGCCQESFDLIRSRLLRYDEYSHRLTGFIKLKYWLFSRHLGMARVIWKIWGLVR